MSEYFVVFMEPSQLQFLAQHQFKTAEQFAQAALYTAFARRGLKEECEYQGFKFTGSYLCFECRFVHSDNKGFVLMRQSLDDILLDRLLAIRPGNRLSFPPELHGR